MVTALARTLPSGLECNQHDRLSGLVRTTRSHTGRRGTDALGAAQPDGATREQTTMSFAWKKVAVGIATAGLVVGLSACSQEREDARDGRLDGGWRRRHRAASSASRCRPRASSAGTGRRAPRGACSRTRATRSTLQYADNEIDQQITQIENMINKGADGPHHRLDRRHGARRRSSQTAADAGHHGHRLRPPDQRHRERRLLRDVRQLPGRPAPGRVHRGARSASTDGAGPFNLELFAGSPDDNNAKFFFSGALDVL